MSDPITVREYTLSLNAFGRPKILTNQDAICVKFMELILLEKNTYPTRPDMGLGIVSRYRFSSPDDLEVLKTDLTNQIDTYLPEFTNVEVEVTQTNKAINIAIIVDEVVYRLVFDSETKTLSSL